MKNNYFKKLIYPKTKEEAVKAIKEICIILYCILAFKTYGVIVRGFDSSEVIEHIIIAVLIFTVQKFKSRVSAILLMLDLAPGQIVLMVLRTAQNRLMVVPFIVELTLIVTSTSLIRTTFLFHKKDSNTDKVKTT